MIEIFKSIEQEIPLLSQENISLNSTSLNEKLKNLILIKTNLPEQQKRLEDEYFGLGPLEGLLAQDSITEVLINSPQEIWFERNGQFLKCSDYFYSVRSYKNIIHRLGQRAHIFTTVEHPFADGQFGEFRISLVGADTSGTGLPQASLRRLAKESWTFDKLQSSRWASPLVLETLKQIYQKQHNILIIGGTGTGKTSVMSSFLNLTPLNQRVLIIEDTSELPLPNGISTKLLTRFDPQGVLSHIDQGVLVQKALRLRPERLMMGEIRGGEAKDFLMALSTGHQGSVATLHASNPHEALIRLEMLVQLGAPQWQIQAIRKLIQLSLQYIVVIEKKEESRQFQALYKISSLEETGFLVEKII